MPGIWASSPEPLRSSLRSQIVLSMERASGEPGSLDPELCCNEAVFGQYLEIIPVLCWKMGLQTLGEQGKGCGTSPIRKLGRLRPA